MPAILFGFFLAVHFRDHLFEVAVGRTDYLVVGSVRHELDALAQIFFRWLPLLVCLRRTSENGICKCHMIYPLWKLFQYPARCDAQRGVGMMPSHPQQCIVGDAFGDDVRLLALSIGLFACFGIQFLFFREWLQVCKKILSSLRDSFRNSRHQEILAESSSCPHCARYCNKCIKSCIKCHSPNTPFS